MKKETTITAIIFYLVGFLTVIEFYTLRGLFTAPLLAFLSLILGAVNVGSSVFSKKYGAAIHYALTTLAVTMPAFDIMFG